METDPLPTRLSQYSVPQYGASKVKNTLTKHLNFTAQKFIDLFKILNVKHEKSVTSTIIHLLRRQNVRLNDADIVFYNSPVANI